LSETLDLSLIQQRAMTPGPLQPRPFLRWAGSKRRLLPQIVPHLPPDLNRYFEPFLGGGALYFLLQPKRALLSDVNEDLVNVWRQVKLDPRGVLTHATARPLDEENYYRIRGGARPESASQRAGEFLYLNRGAFNGLYRVNRAGQFNVPWGAPRTQNIIAADQLLAASECLKPGRVKIEALDFADSVSRSGRGDLVYLDPPYVTAHNENGFIDYNEKIFSWADQVRLAKAAEHARGRGARVIVSNANHESVLKLYPNFQQVILHRQSGIAGNPSKRKLVSEILLIGAPRV
jgi:DNA adenine methylase